MGMCKIDINNVSKWLSHTYKYDQLYDVFITYSNGIHYDYVYTKGDFSGMADIVVQ